MYHYVALLRGINVGGKRLMKMADLRAAFESMGFEQVETYIQSGNVLFSSASTDVVAHEQLIQDTLLKRFGYEQPVLVRTGSSFARTVTSRPIWFGSAPEKFRYDVLFLILPLRPGKALSALELRDGVDRAQKGHRCVFVSRLTARASQSKFSKIAQLPVYQQMTVRNWNTTRWLYERLLQRVEEEHSIRASS